MSEQSTRAPREMAIRAMPEVEYRASGELNEDLGPGYLGLLKIRFSPVDEWTRINSSWENGGVPFLERFAPGAWRKTIQENAKRIRALFQHGQDPQVGDKPLGPFRTLEEDEAGGYAEVALLDTSYNRDLLPGLKDGLYGASHRFMAMRAKEDEHPERSEHNPDGLRERTITEARLFELGPVTFPAYEGSSAGMRSMTDEFLISCFRSDPDRLRSMFERATVLGDREQLDERIAENQRKILDLARSGPQIVDAVTAAVSGSIGGQAGLRQQDTAPSPDDAAPTGTSAAPERRDQGHSVLIPSTGRRRRSVLDV